MPDEFCTGRLTLALLDERVRSEVPESVKACSRRSKWVGMSKTAVKHPGKTASTGAYSAGMSCDGWLFVSGHGSQDLKTGDVISGSVSEETARTLVSIGKVLNEGGCSFEDVVKCTCYLARIEDFDEFNTAYQRFFPRTAPARTTVQAVLWGVLKVEIDAIARVPVKKQ